MRQIGLRILRTDVLDLASVTLQVLELLQVVLWDGGRKALAASEQEANCESGIVRTFNEVVYF